MSSHFPFDMPIESVAEAAYIDRDSLWFLMTQGNKKGALFSCLQNDRESMPATKYANINLKVSIGNNNNNNNIQFIIIYQEEKNLTSLPTAIPEMSREVFNPLPNNRNHLQSDYH